MEEPTTSRKFKRAIRFRIPTVEEAAIKHPNRLMFYLDSTCSVNDMSIKEEGVRVNPAHVHIDLPCPVNCEAIGEDGTAFHLDLSCGKHQKVIREECATFIQCHKTCVSRKYIPPAISPAAVSSEPQETEQSLHEAEQEGEKSEAKQGEVRQEGEAKQEGEESEAKKEGAEAEGIPTPSLLSLPFEVVAKILEWANPPYELSCIAFHQTNSRDYSESMNISFREGPRQWAGISAFHISHATRQWAIQRYGEPCPDDIPFSKSDYISIQPDRFCYTMNRTTKGLRIHSKGPDLAKLNDKITSVMIEAAEGSTWDESHWSMFIHALEYLTNMRKLAIKLQHHDTCGYASGANSGVREENGLTHVYMENDVRMVRSALSQLRHFPALKVFEIEKAGAACLFRKKPRDSGGNYKVLLAMDEFSQYSDPAEAVWMPLDCRPRRRPRMSLQEAAALLRSITGRRAGRRAGQQAGQQ